MTHYQIKEAQLKQEKTHTYVLYNNIKNIPKQIGP